jgi:transposase-like protein
MNDQRYCAKCGADWQAEAIPQEYIDKGYYAPDSTHYSRRIGMYDRELDRTVGWKCPDCGEVVGRET